MRSEIHDISDSVKTVASSHRHDTCRTSWSVIWH